MTPPCTGCGRPTSDHLSTGVSAWVAGVSLPKHSTNSLGKTRRVVTSGRHDDGVRRIEVAMGEHVAHPCDVGPRQLGLEAPSLVVEFLHRLADLDKAHTNRVEHYVVDVVGNRAFRSPREVFSDALTRSGDIEKSSG